MTRSEYMAPFVSDADATARHETYYGQFATPAVRALVTRAIGADAIRASKDEHFNDIPLKRWDCAVSGLPGDIVTALKSCGDFLSLGTGVCILKAAARQIRDESRGVA